MHRNPWWLTPKGETLDAGAFVVGLEFATGQAALTLGKPSPVVFRQAVAGLAADLGERVPRDRFAMVGDDPRADVAAAQRVGCAGYWCYPARRASPTWTATARRPLAGEGPTPSPRRWPTSWPR